MQYLDTEKNTSTIFQLRRSTTTPSTSHSSFTTYNHHASRINGSKQYDRIKSMQTIDPLCTFVFIPERIYAIQAEINFLANATDTSLLYENEINKTLTKAVLYLPYHQQSLC